MNLKADLRAGGAWRTSVLNEADRLKMEFERLPPDTQADTVRLQIERSIATAGALAATPASPMMWWTGSLPERAWAGLGEAREDLLLVEAADILEARIPDILRFGASVNDAAQSRVLEQRLSERPLNRALIRQVWQRHNVERDSNHAAARSFRNFLFLLAAAIGLAVVIWAAKDSSKSAVIAVGMLAGLFTTVTGLTSASRPSGPYAIAPAQALLKAAAGGASALLGVLLVTALPGAHEPSGSTALFYAVVFGVAQTAVTQLADKQADAIVGRSGGHAPASSGPAASPKPV